MPEKLYEKVFEIGKNILKKLWDLKGYQPVSKTTDTISALNTMPWSRTEVVKLPKLQ